jgi:hypothetical protein
VALVWLRARSPRSLSLSVGKLVLARLCPFFVKIDTWLAMGVPHGQIVSLLPLVAL